MAADPISLRFRERIAYEFHVKGREHRPGTPILVDGVVNVDRDRQRAVVNNLSILYAVADRAYPRRDRGFLHDRHARVRRIGYGVVGYHGHVLAVVGTLP